MAVPLLVLASLTTMAFAQMRERYVTEDGGSLRAFVVALDEFHAEDGDRQPRKQALARVATAEAMRLAAERHTRRTGEAAEVVLYEEGVPRTPFTRRVLTKQIAVRLQAGADPAALAAKLGLVSRGSLAAVPGWFVFETTKTGGGFDAADALRAEPGVEAAQAQLARQRTKRFIPNDPLFSSQWHLRDTNSSPGVLGIDVRSVWNTRLGNGIRIGIIDDGLQTAHPDLAANVDTANDHDWLDGTPDDVNPRLALDWHGTPCAGLAAARQHNSLGVSGVAPEATLVGLRLIADGISTTDLQESGAMGWRNDIIQVKSNSWGPEDNGSTKKGPGILTEAAMANAVQTGRGGLGTIFVWAGGNGRNAGDNSNYDGFANSIYSIAVAAVGINGQQVFDSELGANLIVAAPSDDGVTGIVTTDLTGNDGWNDGSEIPQVDYTNTFGGTSASCPIVAGCVALLLESKPTLGWRDVQEILIRSAAKNHPADSFWSNNSAGWHFNHRYGAGLVNAQAAVNLAANWINLPAQQSVESAQSGLNVAIPDGNTTGITRTFDLNASSLHVERVTVTVNINHTSRGQLGMILTSPSGMQSILAETHGDTGDHYTDWTFSSVRNWGENSTGNWTLKITDNAVGTTGTLTSATLKVYGTPRERTVTSLADGGSGSLREALAAAAIAPGPDTITFAPALAGQNITLTSQIAIVDPGGVTIDASGLAGGITLTDTGAVAYRLLDAASNTPLTLRGLTFKNGGGTATSAAGAALHSSTGATVTVERCTFTGNHAGGGGAIYNELGAGAMTLRHCTLAGNTAAQEGGAIFNHGSLMNLTHCTVVGNTANASPVSSGIINYLGTLTLSNSIIAGSGNTGNLQNHSNLLIREGTNIVQGTFTNTGSLGGSGTISATAPFLAALGNYGGPTQTMPPLAGSPVVNAASAVSGLLADQRGLPRGTALWTNDFFTSLGGATARGSGTLDAGSFRLTPNAGNQQGSLILPDLGSLSSFTASFDYTFNSFGGTPADGISFCFGPDPGGLITDVGDGVAHVVRFDIYVDGNPQKGVISYRKNGVVQASNTTALDRFTDQATPQPITISLTSGGLLTVKYKGSTVINAVPTGYTYAAGDRIMFGSRTGGASADQRVDNVGILTQPIGGAADIGAVERPLSTVVSTLADSGEGSLRVAVLDAASSAGADTLTFAPGFTGPIAFGSEIVIGSDVTLDASAIPGGLTLDGGSGSNRLFTVFNGQTVVLKNLTLTGGRITASNINGGAIQNLGTLALTRCTLFNNTATQGSAGAIWNAPGAALTLTQCTLAGNSAPEGGRAGGAIRNEGALALTHCTFSGNSSSFGGGIYNDPGKTATITNSIFSGNTPGADIRNFGIVTGLGTNLIPTLITSSPGTSSGTNLTADPLLAPLGNYGGPTQTMALKLGSPARNAASATGITSDQRGFPIVGGVPDIGAYEAGTLTNYDNFIWETLPATATLAQRATTIDFDGDGQTNTNEWLARTDPGSPASVFRVTQTSISGSLLNVTFPTVSGRSYTLQSSPNLAAPWTTVGSPTAGNGSPKTLPVTITGSIKYFYRVTVGDP